MTLLTISALAAAVLSAATWVAFRTTSPPTWLVSGLSLGLGLVVLSVCVSATYVWRMAGPFQGRLLVATPGALTFVVLYAMHLIKHRPEASSVIASSMLCGLGIYFLGLLTWLATACAYGDCL